MRCPNCKRETGRLKAFYEDGEVREYCAACLGVSEARGPRTAGLLTRNSLRVRTEAVRNEGDTLAPHAYNKATRKLEPNPEFVKLHARNADQFISEKEARSAGMPKLAEAYREGKEEKRRAKAAQKVTFEGSAERGIGRVLGK